VLLPFQPSTVFRGAHGTAPATVGHGMAVEPERGHKGLKKSNSEKSVLVE